MVHQLVVCPYWQGKQVVKRGSKNGSRGQSKSLKKRRVSRGEDKRCCFF